MEHAPEHAARRSTRVLVNIPVVISSVKTKGIPFEAPAVTLVVSKHGAKIQTTMHMQVGTYVRLTNPATNHSQLARVAWVGKSDDRVARLAFGIELDDPQNLWGIYLPPEDWLESPSWDEEEEPAPYPLSSPSAEQGLPSRRLGDDTVFGSSEAPPQLPPLEIPEEGVDVFVRGLSSAHMPFQEHSVLHPVTETEATVQVRPVVDFGKLVQVVFPTVERIVRARVSGVSERQMEGKWKMWVRFPHPFRILKQPEGTQAREEKE